MVCTCRAAAGVPGHLEGGYSWASILALRRCKGAGMVQWGAVHLAATWPGCTVAVGNDLCARLASSSYKTVLGACFHLQCAHADTANMRAHAHACCMQAHVARVDGTYRALQHGRPHTHAEQATYVFGGRVLQVE